MKQLVDVRLRWVSILCVWFVILASPQASVFAQEVTFGGNGNPWVVRNLVQQAINEKGLPYGNIGQGALLRSTNGSGGGFRWNDNGQQNGWTLNKVCEVLGYRRYVRSTCLDNERSHRYPNGKCNYHSPGDNSLTFFDLNQNRFRSGSAKQKYHKTWIASITCADALDPCTDGIDNDGDGLIDYDDPICGQTNGEREAAECQDKLDNDNDGKIDYNGYCAPHPTCRQRTISTSGRVDEIKKFTVPCDGVIRISPRAKKTLVSVVRRGTHQSQYMMLCDDTFVKHRCRGRKHLCCGKDDRDIPDNGALMCNRINQFIKAPAGEPGKVCPTDGTAARPLWVGQGDVLSLGQWKPGEASSFTFYPTDPCQGNEVAPDPDCDGPNDDSEEPEHVSECTPGDEENRDCWTDGVGICELGWQGRWCKPNGTWSHWGACEAEFHPGQKAEDCHNGLDDDCDGHTDGDDTDCQSGGGGWPPNPGGTIDGGWYYGDANTDGCVDIADLMTLVANWGMTGAIWADGDFDSSSVIDIADFSLLMSNWNKCNSGPRSFTPANWNVPRNLSATQQFVYDVLTSLQPVYQRNGRGVRRASRGMQAAVKRFEASSPENAQKIKNAKRVLARSMKRAENRQPSRKNQNWERFAKQWSSVGRALSQTVQSGS